MHFIRHWVRIFFGFSRTETNGFLILLPLTALVLFSVPVYEAWHTPPPLASDDALLDSLLKTLVWEVADTTPHVLMAFDPNQVSDSLLIRMGLSGRMAERWVNFRNKGGHFRSPWDVKKLYGIDTSWVQRAIPYMQFPLRKPITYKKKQEEPPIDINLADTIQLDGVYGIGPSLARRITTYRYRLGGFVSMDQLHEVYGLDSSVVSTLRKKFFIAVDFTPLQMPLQSATAEELSRHPYIKRKEAQAIVTWRLQHQGILVLSDLEKIHGITAAWILRVKPYLQIEP
jgi:DNA uptake protein ComE-like DNA-binding protein